MYERDLPQPNANSFVYSFIHSIFRRIQSSSDLTLLRFLHFKRGEGAPRPRGEKKRGRTTHSGASTYVPVASRSRRFGSLGRVAWPLVGRTSIASVGNRAQKRGGHSRDERVYPPLPREFVSRRGSSALRESYARTHDATCTYARDTCNRRRVRVESGALTAHVRCVSRAKPAGISSRRRSRGIALFSYARCLVVEERKGYRDSRVVKRPRECISVALFRKVKNTVQFFFPSTFFFTPRGALGCTSTWRKKINGKGARQEVNR